MQAYALGDRKGGALTLHRVERPDPVPGYGEAVIKVHATGLGARDLSIMRSTWPPAEKKVWQNPPPPERIPLQDGAGEVIAVGPGVYRVIVGDRVMATHYPKYIDGAWDFDAMAHMDFGDVMDGFLAEKALVPADALVKIPARLSYEEAAPLQSSGLTPWRALTVEAKTQPGETVLTLGSGNVSVFGLQIAKALGARVIITSSSDEKLEKLRALGADIGINYRSYPEWHREVLAQTGGRGADVVLNTIGYPTLEKCLLSCASNARVMHIGARPVIGASAEPATFTQLPNLISKCISIKGFTVASRRMFEDFVRALEVNRIKPVIDRVFGFDQVLDAIRYYESGAKIGKVVIKVN
ncbi:MAG: NAD(P)-dependent alcohol dehydrogenase [Betaproteobacteria bacterium]|nr:NAD(P)-dependent alcohol dehydrogenase [Betaproteobacteria bacterium]